MRQICNSATRQNTRGKIFDVVIAMRTAGRERFNELSWHHKFHKRKYLPSKRIAPLVFFLPRGRGGMLFSEKCQQKFRG